MTDYPALLRALTEGGVRFIIVGGAAATAHGSARVSLNLKRTAFLANIGRMTGPVMACQ